MLLGRPNQLRAGQSTSPTGADADVRLPHAFVPRPYQLDVFRKKFPQHFPDLNGLGLPPILRGVLIWHRRAGKDKLAINLITTAAWEELGNYLYMFPQQAQAKKVIWRGIDKSGFRFLDHIPRQIIKQVYNSEMLVELKNGSTVQLGGSDNYDSWMGTNPKGILFSEYSLQDPAAWNYFRPILVENGGWAWFIYTPRGYNHGYDLYEAAVKNPAWYVSKLTVDDTKDANGAPIITSEMIQAEIESGMPQEMVDQEFYCSFEAGVMGAYYADLIATMRKASPSPIGFYPHDPNQPVITAWDLGFNDATAIWFVQPTPGGGGLRVIDYYEDSNQPLTHYIKVVHDKPYNYLEHYAPHDVEVTDYTTGKTRKETALELGIDFITAPKLARQDGIEAVRGLLPRCQFDENSVARGIEALMGYQKVYDDRLQRYRDQPLHNWACHGADAFRTLAVCWHDDNFAPSRGNRLRTVSGLRQGR